MFWRSALAACVSVLVFLRLNAMWREAQPLVPVDVNASREVQSETQVFVLTYLYDGRTVEMFGTVDTSFSCGADSFRLATEQGVSFECRLADRDSLQRVLRLTRNDIATVRGRMYVNDDDPVVFLQHCEIVSIAPRKLL